MKLSKQQKVSVAVLALALAALAVDRVFLSPGEAGPRRADAAPRPSGSAAATAGRAGGLASPMVLASGISLADRLGGFSKAKSIEVAGVRDAFTPSETWMPKKSEPVATATPVVQRPRFSKSHKLMAVMAGPQGSAIVDGVCYTVGDPKRNMLDGYTLVSVGQQAAVFQLNNDRIVLELPQPPEE